ncbi:two-component system, OmpR family, osmolarity sensor histidine kinase EnvZ [Palleronia marisminoris]|uniref:histidine kinase n=1 Tax=Palleronia marisminoris TaxID=315423 RepID=A0A1Y5R9F7_9RHOB|nr:ATP-binding protein [Palleronia marisminoris]SFG09598.1 two-component system, OmpR family, osmolarity sensor histidine kinase EnvZ [Palleronia marisminoris]SLN12241.1 Osmolarity sensor protein EnvZ [Palleronia marisminoris]
MADLSMKRYAPRSLYARAALILLLPVISLQIVVSVVFIQRLFEDVTQQMSTNVAYELRYLRDAVDGAPTPEAARRALEALGRDFDIGTTLPDPVPVTGTDRRVYDLSGRLVIPTLTDELGGVLGIDLSTDDGVVDMTVDTRHGPLRFRFDRDRVSARNPHQFLVIMILTALLMTVVAYLFLKNQLRPIKRLADAALAFGKGRSVPYSPRGAFEVRSAGAAFLDMRARIERQIEQRTMMLSGISHDLRTPLTRLRLELEMLDPAEAEPMRRDLDEMQQMIDAFLDFAREGAVGEPELIDPTDLVNDVVEKARRAGGTVERGRIQSAGTVTLNSLAVARALENLVGNALRYGTRARVSLDRTGRALVFVVEDDGPGIPVEARAEAMRAFTRLDGARNQNRGAGVGLGLAIAQDVARQHGGVLRLGKSVDLGGLRADLVIAL